MLRDGKPFSCQQEKTPLKDVSSEPREVTNTGAKLIGTRVEPEQNMDVKQ